MDSDHRSSVDPEPWRCRRTDGKRWRCYFEALVHEKYCEKHMHRGSQRSRKHVEVSGVDMGSNEVAKGTCGFSSSVISPRVSVKVSKSASEVDMDSNEVAKGTCGFSSSVISPRVSVKVSKMSASVTTGLHLGVPSSDFSRSSPMNIPTGPASFSCKSIIEEKGSNSIQVYQCTSGSSFGALNSQGNGKNGSSCVNGKAFSFDQKITGQKSQCNQQNEKNPEVPVALKLGSSPKSVFGSCIGSSFNFDNKAGKGTETLRCQRTDGKRWQCKKNAVTNKRYCETHIHRGAKRTSVQSKMNDSAGMISASTPSSCAMPKTSENYKNLNTDLTISIAENSGHKSIKTYSNSSSDSTTVTDDNVTIC